MTAASRLHDFAPELRVLPALDGRLFQRAAACRQAPDGGKSEPPPVFVRIARDGTAATEGTAKFGRQFGTTSRQRIISTSNTAAVQTSPAPAGRRLAYAQGFRPWPVVGERRATQRQARTSTSRSSFDELNAGITASSAEPAANSIYRQHMAL